MSILPEDFWGYSEGMGRALSRGGSIGVRGLKNEEVEPVLADEVDDLFVDSDVNNGGGWFGVGALRRGCWSEPAWMSPSV